MLIIYLYYYINVNNINNRKLTHTNLNKDIELMINHPNNTNINKYYKYFIINYKNIIIFFFSFKIYKNKYIILK